MNRALRALFSLPMVSLFWLGCSSGGRAQVANSGAGGAGASGITNGAGAGASGIGLGGNLGTATGTNDSSAGVGGPSGGTSGGTNSAGGQGGRGAGTVGLSGAAGTIDAAGMAGFGGALEPTAYPTPSTQHRAISAHDPSMIQVADTYYLFATGGKLSFRSSTNLSTWSNLGNLFSSIPAWIATELGVQIVDLWAPDISFQNGTYRVYYAGSVFGSNHSVIGLVTNTTLDPANSAYKWVDQGLVIESNKAGSTDDWNAIDPNFIRDESGNDWLVFGSFWSGIKLLRLDPLTGKPSTTDTTLYSLASNAGGVEAPSIVFHNGYYYLFVSYDLCCKNVNSTYRTMVGRSAAITGPYTDDNGKAMLQGNAVQMLAKDGRYIGPGGGTAFRDGSLYYYAYHYYDGDANGTALLMMRPISWPAPAPATDWPVFSTALWQ
jgi:arabinan endo-1,5-alpha-L-arabinosidase